MAERIYLTIGEVLEIHHQQIDNYGGHHGIRDKALLESAVFRPQIGYYNTIAEEAAALMESLANNTRSSMGISVSPLLLCTPFCWSTDLTSKCSRWAYEFMMQSISAGKFRFGPILEWINKHIRAS